MILADLLSTIDNDTQILIYNPYDGELFFKGQARNCQHRTLFNFGTVVSIDTTLISADCGVENLLKIIAMKEANIKINDIVIPQIIIGIKPKTN